VKSVSIYGSFFGQFLLRYDAVVDDSNQLGAFSSQYLHEQVPLVSSGTPMGIGVFGVLRNSTEQGADPDHVLSNEKVHLSIRTSGGVCYLKKKLGGEFLDWEQNPYP
jgi:hypothetical protein